MRKPAHMRLPYRSAKDLAGWLLSKKNSWVNRPASFFTFNCNDDKLNYNFDHLLQIYQEDWGNIESLRDPVWIQACRYFWAAKYCGYTDTDCAEITADTVLDIVDFTLIENATEHVMTKFINAYTGLPDDDLWNTTWEGEPVHARFILTDSNNGHNHIGLHTFQNIACDGSLEYSLKEIRKYDGLYSASWVPNQPLPIPHWHDFKRLCAHVRTLDHYFSTNSFCKDIELNMAYIFFESECDGLPNPTGDKQQANKIKVVQKEAKQNLRNFCQRFLAPRPRAILPQSETIPELNSSWRRRRRLTFNPK